MARLPEDLETEPETRAHRGGTAESRAGLGLVILWSSEDTDHIGAWLPVFGSDGPRVFGRGGDRAEDDLVRLRPVRQRPGVNEPLPPLTTRSLSRVQLQVRARQGDALEVENLGRCSLSLDGQELSRAELRPGDVVEVGAQLVLLCAERPLTMPKVSVEALQAFAEPDDHGYVGESPAAWKLRQEIATIARLPGHVLVLGASGTGKELVAAALHGQSGRRGPLVARNAATLPEGLVDAELFGNLKGYPNPGMAERRGLVGTADGGTLFLDEFGELALDAQAHLLRVLDAGEYQRLGEAVARRSNFRLIAATNRPESALRADVLARFDFRLRLPDLAERPEDLTLIARHLLRTMTEGSAELRARAFGAATWPKLSTSFVRSLVRHPFKANVRELRSLLWQALPAHADRVFEWPARTSGLDPAPAPQSVRAAEVRRVLEDNNGSIEKSWRALGLSSRYALTRLLKKYGIAVTKHPRPK